MRRLPLTLYLSILLAAAPCRAEIYKCIVDGKTVFTSGSVAPEGCVSQEVKAIPYDPKEAARTEAQLKRMDDSSRALEAEQTRRREASQLLRARRATETATRAAERQPARGFSPYGYRYAPSDLK